MRREGSGAPRGARRARSDRARRLGGRARAGRGATEHGRSGGHLIDRHLSEIVSRVRLVGRATPVNFGVEVARVAAVWEAGGEEEPRFEYGGRVDLSAERRALEGIVDQARRVAVGGGERDEGLAGLYAGAAGGGALGGGGGV